MIRVLRVITRLNIGGPARHVVALDAGLKTLGFETLLVHGALGPSEGSLEHLLESHQLPAVCIPELGRRVAPWSDLVALMKIARLLQQWRPDIVHTHTAKAGALGRLAAAAYNAGRVRRKRCAIIHTYHGHVFNGYFGRAGSAAVRIAERILGSMTNQVIAISELQREDLTRRYRIADADRVAVVPLGLQLDPLVSRPLGFRGLRESLGFAPDDLVIGYVGRLVPIKAVDVLLRAVASARRRSDRFKVLIVGDGESRVELERLAEALGIAPGVRFLGWREDLVDIYAAMDVFALTSLNEGTPVSLIEALASGLPVVASAVGGVPDVLRHGAAGTMIPPGQPEALAEALHDFERIRSRRSSDADARRAAISSRYGTQRLVEEIEKLYRGLLAGARR